eukprot:2578529-Rhodomonas_salina.4
MGSCLVGDSRKNSRRTVLRWDYEEVESEAYLTLAPIGHVVQSEARGSTQSEKAFSQYSPTRSLRIVPYQARP